MDHDIVPHITMRGPFRYLVCAPLGIVANLFDPKDDPAEARACDERGQHEIDVAVSKINDHFRQAHGTGHLAIAFGVPLLQRKAAEKVSVARARPTSKPAASKPAVAKTEAPKPAGSQPTASQPASAVAPTVERDDAVAATIVAPATSADSTAAAVTNVVAADLAIPGYDTLSASQVVECLAGLDRSERETVRAYEAGNRGRRTILGKLDQLQATG